MFSLILINIQYKIPYLTYLRVYANKEIGYMFVQ